MSQKCLNHLTGFNPIEKNNFVKLDHFPQVSGWKQKASKNTTASLNIASGVDTHPRVWPKTYKNNQDAQHGSTAKSPDHRSTLPTLKFGAKAPHGASHLGAEQNGTILKSRMGSQG